MSTPDNVRDPFELIGTTIEGKYRVASVIGDGGFGVVYRGVHTGFGELIAIKCLKIPNNLDEKHREGLLEQLREEGRLLHKLSRATSGIVQALDVGAMTTPAGVWVPFLVLEWLDGETVGELLKRREQEGKGGMSVAEAVELLTPAARALAVAHQHKIAHRDVKPANLFVTKVGDKQTVKVLDFGIAKVLHDTTITEALAMTAKGPSAFTPRYGAPEQFNKQRGASGPWTDVFALALIVVELATGRRALDGDDPTQLYVASADPTMRPTFRGRGIDVSDAVEAVIARALHVEPKYRYADAGEFWDALAQAAGVLPEGARTSNPAVSSGRGKADKPAGSDHLNTAEYAAQEELSAGAEGPRSGPPEPHAVTKPVESLQKGKAAPVVVSAKETRREGAKAASPPTVTSASEHVAAGAKEPPAGSRGFAEEDPMAETPFFARESGSGADERPKKRAESRAAAAVSAGATRVSAGSQERTTVPSSRDVPSSAPASQVPASSGRGLWIALLLIGAVAGVTAYLYFTGPGKSVQPGGPRASASVSARPVATLRPPVSASATATATASATASASASASDSASASAAEPPAPPEDMVYVGPLTAKLGEGATLRDVILTKGYYIEKHEVPVRAYQACVDSGACTAANEPKVIARFTEAASADAGADAGPSEAVLRAEETWKKRCSDREPDHPMNCLSYSQAEQYCRWKKRRLPTEAEWEAAAQGAEQRAYPWGNSRPGCETACVDKNQECRGGNVAPCAVGSHAGDKTPTEIFDLAGNVAEWVLDGWAAKPAGGTDPKASPWAKTHVVRGGSFFDNLDRLRSATRRGVPSGAAEAWIGMRCAMDVPAAP